MRPFEIDNLYVVPYSQAESEIRDCDLAQYRGAGWFSKSIQYATGGPHSHSALLTRNNGTVDVREIREFRGGRMVPLRSQAEKHKERIDVFRPNWHLWPFLDGQAVRDSMRVMCGKRYGYRGILRLAIQRIPLLWRLWPATVDDRAESDDAPFCSHAVATAYRIGGVDAVPRKPDYMVTPNDLTHSLLFSYVFTIGVPEPSESLTVGIGSGLRAKCVERIG